MRRFWMKPAARYPADPRAVFILGLSFVTGLPMLWLHVEPGTLNAIVPSWTAFLWGFLLVAGAGITLLGMSRDTVNGIILEQVGSVIVGCATIFYGVAALVVAGTSYFLPISIILGFGLSCFWRWGQLQALLEQTYRIVEKAKRDSRRR